MKCDFCNDNEATISLIKIVDNKIEKINVCSKCVNKITLSSGEEFIEDMADMLSKIFDVDISPKDELDKKFFGLVKGLEDVDDKKCNFCGIKLSTIKKIGKVGCFNCYRSFIENLGPVLEAIHGSSNYKGKLPSSADESIKLQMEIKKLNNRLQEEIFIENFEEAARIRDAIGKLRKRLTSDKKVKKI